MRGLGGEIDDDAREINGPEVAQHPVILGTCEVRERTVTSDPAAVASLLRSRARTGELWVPVSGSSMGARYAPGSRLLVAAVDRGPRCGEVWVFCARDGSVVGHRFLARQGQRYVFRGDATSRADAPVPAEWLIGIVRAVDDGTRRWRPHPGHAIAPVIRAVLQGARRLLGRTDTG